MKTHKILFFILLISINQNIISQNVLINDQGNPNEPSIMMDPNNPQILVAGSNLNYYYHSNDGGATWISHVIGSNYGVWGDPVIDVDIHGHFYFFHLSNPSTAIGHFIDRIVCQKSTDNGNTWTGGTYAGLNGTKAQDKHWSVVDRTNNNIYITWTQFDEYGSENEADSSIILFSKSLDAGNTWSAAKRINKNAGDCIDGDNTVEGAVPAVGPNGEIYVAWAGPHGITFNRSNDVGETWLAEEILIDPMPGGWNYDISGIYRANGLPVTKCDLSGGANHGTIYVNWSDQRNGVSDTDIWLSKSTDGGDTWSSPIRVNDDETNRQQFLTWMDIDQTNGNLHFVFYDRRNYSDDQTDVYLAYSSDGGTTFKNIKISESPFMPHGGIFFGDYTNIVAHNNIVRPIWTRLHDGQLSIWTDITPQEQLLSTDELSKEVIEDVKQYPNPVINNTSYVSFKLHDLSVIRLEIYDTQGNMVHTIIDNKQMDYGKYIIPIHLDELHLPTGVYYHKLSVNDKSKTLKTLIIK